MEQTRSKKR